MRPSRQLLSLKYLKSSLPKVPTTVEPLSFATETKARNVDLSSLVWDAKDLNQYFRFLSFLEPLPAQMSKADKMFQVLKTKHEWTCASYLDIPDIKVKQKEEERQYRLDLVEPYQWNDYHKSLQQSRTSFGIETLLLRPLPEVLFVGHTNAGKSSLINNVFAQKELSRKDSSEADLAFESKQAGFTKCLVCFNVSSKLRLIDTPGYGNRSIENQGSLVLDYVLQRPQLRMTYMIVDGVAGFKQEDEQIMNYLQESKSPFEIVFTRLDEVVKKKFPREIIKKKVLSDEKAATALASQGNSQVVEHFLEMIGNAELIQYSMLSGVHFNNSRCNNILKRRTGYRELRGSILNSCGL